MSLTMSAEWLKANPPSDLQELVRQHGGHDRITAAAWAPYDQALANWRLKYRRWHEDEQI
jgi:hypothetical protein